MTWREAFHHLFGWRCVTPAVPINDAFIQELIRTMTEEFQAQLTKSAKAFADDKAAAVKVESDRADAALAAKDQAVRDATTAQSGEFTSALAAITPADPAATA